MFGKLKRKFILTATLSSAAVLLIAFSAIYFIVSHNIHHRPPMKMNEQAEQIEPAEPAEPTNPTEPLEQDPQQDIFENRIKADREKSLETLLISLIMTGVAVEILVVLVSFFLAEHSIKPVREAYEAQKSFIANASHEIKTPLAIIQANLEAADIKGNPWLDNVAKKTEELSVLNTQLLSLARMDVAPNDEAKPEAVDLLNLVEETASCYAPKLAEKKAELKLSGKGTIKLNRADLNQLLNILIDNAVKYCDKKVIVEITENKIAIKNDGATISKTDQKHIFDRFYQTDKTKPGVGLGLSIAKQLAEKNHWNLKVESGKKTTTFTLNF